jgi:cysteine-rich repeat protein
MRATLALHLAAAGFTFANRRKAFRPESTMRWPKEMHLVFARRAPLELSVALLAAVSLVAALNASAAPADGITPADTFVCRLEAGMLELAAPVCSADAEDAPVCASDCGDGIVVGAEQCDDGNFLNEDGCSASCLVEPGFVCSGDTSSCQSICGNGRLDGLEACDDGDQVEADGCSPSCKVDDGWVCKGSPSECRPVCGDGVAVGTEQCDDAEANGSELSCCTEGCTFVARGTACDDGQVCTAGDACNASGRCAGADPVTCDDGNICTDEVCDPERGCRYTVRSPPCDRPSAGLGALQKDRASALRRLAMPKRIYEAPVHD